jgi:hypothetical protein
MDGSGRALRFLMTVASAALHGLEQKCQHRYAAKPTHGHASGHGCSSNRAWVAKRSDVNAGYSGRKAIIETARSSGRSPGLGAYSRRAPEIPMFVIDVHRSHFIRRKGNFLKAADLNNATLAGNDLVERSTVPELHGNHLVTYAGLSGSLQVIDKPTGYWN